MKNRVLAVAAACIVMASAAALAADDSTWIEVAGGDWQPSAENIAALEQALKAALPAAAKHHGSMSSWSRYWFQYQGQKPASGSPVIHVNGFCDTPSRYTNVHNRWVFVSGGGACYFQGDFDPASNQMTNLMVNDPG